MSNFFQLRIGRDALLDHREYGKARIVGVHNQSRLFLKRSREQKVRTADYEMHRTRGGISRPLRDGIRLWLLASANAGRFASC